MAKQVVGATPTVDIAVKRGFDEVIEFRFAYATDYNWTGCTAQFEARKYAGQPAVLSLTCNVVQFDSKTAQMVFPVPAASTVDAAFGAYQFDCQLTFVSGALEPVVSGRLFVEDRVIRT